MSACTPYPATFPCETPVMSPVLVNPYLPTSTPLPPEPLVASLRLVADDELTAPPVPVPEPPLSVLVALLCAGLLRRRRPR